MKGTCISSDLHPKWPRPLVLDVRAAPGDVGYAVEVFRREALNQGLPDRVLFRATLILEECANNITRHALAGDERRVFRIVVEQVGNTLVLEFRDQGPAFDPTVAPAPGRPPEDELLPRGWGIPLVRRYSDSLAYARELDENVLRVGVRMGEEGSPAVEGLVASSGTAGEAGGDFPGGRTGWTWSESRDGDPGAG